MLASFFPPEIFVEYLISGSQYKMRLILSRGDDDLIVFLKKNKFCM